LTLVVDASVALKWLVPESLSDAAENVLDANEDLVAPDLLLVEAANALWKKVRRREMTDPDASEVLAVLGTMRLELRPTAPHLDRALKLASALDHPVYDCVYLALAESARARLVTDDASLVRRVRRRRGMPSVIALSTFSSR
jgi:predicted nucleic acid-binding protein